MIIGITEVSAIWQVQKNYKNEGSNTFVVVAECETVPNNRKKTDIWETGLLKRYHIESEMEVIEEKQFVHV